MTAYIKRLWHSDSFWRGARDGARKALILWLIVLCGYGIWKWL